MSARISAAATGRIFVKYDTGDFHTKICAEIPNLVKIGE
jgi:hypothetical protein